MRVLFLFLALPFMSFGQKGVLTFKSKRVIVLSDSTRSYDYNTTIKINYNKHTVSFYANGDSSILVADSLDTVDGLSDTEVIYVYEGHSSVKKIPVLIGLVYKSETLEAVSVNAEGVILHFPIYYDNDKSLRLGLPLQPISKKVESSKARKLR